MIDIYHGDRIVQREYHSLIIRQSVRNMIIL